MPCTSKDKKKGIVLYCTGDMYSNQNASKSKERKKNVIIFNYQTFPASLFQSKNGALQQEKREKGHDDDRFQVRSPR